MTTDDTSRSPSLGGEQREGPTGREPGLPSEWEAYRAVIRILIDVSGLNEARQRLQESLDRLRDEFPATPASSNNLAVSREQARRTALGIMTRRNSFIAGWIQSAIDREQRRIRDEMIRSESE